MSKSGTLLKLFQWLGKATDQERKSEYIDLGLIHCIGSHLFTTNGFCTHFCENTRGVHVGSHSADQQRQPLSGKLCDYAFHFFRIVPAWPTQITISPSDVIRLGEHLRHLAKVETPGGPIQFPYRDLVTAMDGQTVKLRYRSNTDACRLDLPDNRSAIVSPIRI